MRYFANSSASRLIALSYLHGILRKPLEESPFKTKKRGSAPAMGSYGGGRNEIKSICVVGAGPGGQAASKYVSS